MFLDLPQPWEALPNSIEVLKEGGKLVSFSPCIEQIQKTAELLRCKNFAEIRVFESLCKAWGTQEIKCKPKPRPVYARGGRGHVPLEDVHKNTSRSTNGPRTAQQQGGKITAAGEQEKHEENLPKSMGKSSRGAEENLPEEDPRPALKKRVLDKRTETTKNSSGLGEGSAKQKLLVAEKQAIHGTGALARDGFGDGSTSEWRSIQLPMRGHTSYIMVATRFLKDELEQPKVA